MSSAIRSRTSTLGHITELSAEQLERVGNSENKCGVCYNEGVKLFGDHPAHAICNPCLKSTFEHGDGRVKVKCYYCQTPIQTIRNVKVIQPKSRKGRIFSFTLGIGAGLMTSAIIYKGIAQRIALKNSSSFFRLATETAAIGIWTIGAMVICMKNAHQRWRYGEWISIQPLRSGIVISSASIFGSLLSSFLFVNTNAILHATCLSLFELPVALIVNTLVTRELKQAWQFTHRTASEIEDRVKRRQLFFLSDALGSCTMGCFLNLIHVSHDATASSLPPHASMLNLAMIVTSLAVLLKEFAK